MNDTINQVGAGAPADRLREALAGLLAIVGDSRGVAGYHLNGAIAEWDEFPEVEAARATLADLPECGCCGQTGECDAGCDARLAAPAAPVRMCTTMGRPVSECGCPDCGSSLIDWTAAPAVQNAGIQAALDYSRNFANSKPGIGRTEKEHILGLVSLLERVAATAAPVADGTTSDKYRAELYDEVWQRARDMGYGNVTDALVELERLKAAAPVVQEWPVVMPTDAQLIEIARRLGALPELCYTVDRPDIRWRVNPEVRAMVREVLTLYATPPAHHDAGALVEALEHARQFIRNGIDLGFIRMPDADTDDPAHETLPKIEAALSTYRAALAGKGGE